MTEYVTLLGAEKVEHAGRNISTAAETMRMAALQIHEDLERHRESMWEWLEALKTVLAQAQKEGD